jgi:hypothetical protein
MIKNVPTRRRRDNRGEDGIWSVEAVIGRIGFERIEAGQIGLD